MAIRTANRTAPELQDLLAGGRLVHIAGADLVNRCAEGLTGKFGYSPVGIMSAANAPDSLRALRSKYPRLFLLVDGFSAVGANAKNCALAFDKMVHSPGLAASPVRRQRLYPAGAAVRGADEAESFALYYNFVRDCHEKN